jgi:pimeloyl-ACP methyl ester carboxylesterase
MTVPPTSVPSTAAMVETATTTLRDGRMIAWSEVGDPAGQVVLSCLGTPHSRVPHPDDHAVAVAAGLRVVAPERPGFGLSDRAPGRTVESWAADAVELLEHLGLAEVAVLGSSGGGPFAVGLAALHPARVVALALAASGVPGPALNDEELARLTESRLLERGAWLADLVHGDPDAFREATGITPTPWWTRMLTEAFRQGPRAHAEDHLLNATDWSHLLPRLTVPVRLWHGEADDNIRLDSVRWMAARMPSPELSVVEGAGHDIGDRWPEILGWLRSHLMPATDAAR